MIDRHSLCSFFLDIYSVVIWKRVNIFQQQYPEDKHNLMSVSLTQLHYASHLEMSLLEVGVSWLNLIVRNIIILNLGFLIPFNHKQFLNGVIISYLIRQSFSSGNSNTGAIAGGVAAGAALLFAAPAIALAYWRRRKPQDHFFDVPG